MTPAAQQARLEKAEALLQECVYRSRAAQAAGVELQRSGRADGGPAGNCGLGKHAAVDLELTDRGRELFDELFGAPPEAEELERMRAVMAAWVEEQDALDRKRNHFLRDFRHANGFDRGAYSDEQRSAYESGLEAINGEALAKRREAAARLLG